MSADNILVIVPRRNRIEVYDTNFSDVSSHEFWKFDGTRTPEETRQLIEYIASSPVSVLVNKEKSVGGAENFCRRYQRVHIVEYGFTEVSYEHK